MSAASPSIQAAPGMRQLGAAFGAVIAAVALAILVAFGQQAAAKPDAAPAAGTAPVTHDHGWSSAPTSGSPYVDAKGSGDSNRARLPQ